ncbi:MAG: 2-iminoacetate synthase ThiH, partial [Proteobacteria bacterium]|nr:2-iminoacetate synthase ThiH [Pseudomonadota bacterium]
MTFYDEFAKYGWDAVRQDVYSRGEDDVLRALRSDGCDLTGLVSLLSPAADSRLEDIAVRAQALTERRFGRVISLYAPLYLSSKCCNSCAYCSFQAANPIDRVTLTPAEVEAEGKWLRKQGFRHILLVSGEDRSSAGMGYLSRVVSGLRPVFDSITIEIYPMETGEYERLGFLGVDGLAVYQETYNRDRYAEVHRAGPKK